MFYVTRWQKPAVSSWSGFSRLGSLSDQLDRLFEGAFTDVPQSGWGPVVDVYEDKDAVTLKAELPGLKKEDVAVTFSDQTLTISGERKSVKPAEGTQHRAERYFGRFERSFTLPATVAGDRIQADYQDGILTVTVPKAEAAKPRQVQVEVK